MSDTGTADRDGHRTIHVQNITGVITDYFYGLLGARTSSLGSLLSELQAVGKALSPGPVQVSVANCQRLNLWLFP